MNKFQESNKSIPWYLKDQTSPEEKISYIKSFDENESSYINEYTRYSEVISSIESGDLYE